ncbi:hypothetical protein Fmac_005538 [Flemingia macrophylla]|uniref:Histone deacetylase interacting domain-containing protein n=1 Tax=Flemingia macrophylla TaxID=520843 RepID=A0ABD1N9E0_9FABA
MTDSGLAYLNTVKDAFKNKSEKYDKFLELMKNFTAETERFNLVRVIEELKELFKGHKDLILGFNIFLPKGYEIKIPLQDEQPPHKRPDAFVEAEKFLLKIKVRTLNLSDIATTIPCCILDETRFQGHDSVYESFLSVLKMLRVENKTLTAAYREITELLRDHEDLLNELPHLSNNTSRTDYIHFVHNREKSSAVPKIKKVHACKGRTRKSYGDPGHGVDHILDRHWSEKENRNYYQVVTDFLEKYPDLKKGFNEKLKMEESLWDEEHELKRLKVEGWDKIRHHDSDDWVKEAVGECQEWDKSIAVVNKNVTGPKLSLCDSKKYSAKSVNELDVSLCEQCTPSYYLLPKEFQIPSSSQRTKIAAEVLNDHWICVDSSIKDYSFKHRSKNPYEMILFECEDDRIELDMQIETAKSTTMQVKELIEKITTNVIKRGDPINIEKHFTAQNLRCIERLYGDYGFDVLDAARKNASQVLPFIVTRLEQKQKEWIRCRANFNKLWAEVYAENYYKSLDHRSSRIQKA